MLEVAADDISVDWRAAAGSGAPLGLAGASRSGRPALMWPGMRPTHVEPAEVAQTPGGGCRRWRLLQGETLLTACYQPVTGVRRTLGDRLFTLVSCIPIEARA